MQGSAKTNDFMLGTATIMLGRQEDLFNLSDKDSIGLVKNVTVKTNPGFVELTQGIQNSLVYSVMNANAASVNAEMFEYTPRNLAYSLSLDGASFERLAIKTTLSAAYVAPADPVVLGADEIELTAVTGLAADKMLLIHTGNADNVMIRKIVSIDAGTKTVTLDSGLPLGVGLGNKVEVVNVLPIGSQETPPFLACKIVGTLANGQTIPMLFPKVRIKSGLNMAFKTDNFDNIPFELSIYDLVETDPHYEMFKNLGDAKGMILD